MTYAAIGIAGIALLTLLGGLWRIPWPNDPGDQRRLLALGFLAGGGVAMTVYAGYSLWLVRARPDYAFYLGAGSLFLIAIVLTGFAGLLIRRTIKGNVGAAAFEISDQEMEP